MRRRALLAALASGSALLAGCGSTSPTETDSTETEPTFITDTPTATNTPTGTPPETPEEVIQYEGGGVDRSTFADLETVPRTYALLPATYRMDDIDVRMRFTQSATADAPTRLVASIWNTASNTESVELRRYPPFDSGISEPPQPPGEQGSGHGLSDGSSLVLAPTGESGLVDEAPDVVRDDDGLWRLRGGLLGGIDPWLPDSLSLDPNEAVRVTFNVVGHHEGSGRPTGVYEFPGLDRGSLRIVVWETGAPGPDADSRFAGASVPSLPVQAGPDERSGVTWFHEVDESTGAYLRPETEETDLPAGITFQFVNHTRESLGCGHWYVFKLHDGEWYDLGPYARTQECRRMGPGMTKTWTLHAYRGGGSLPPARGRAYPYLGGGRYAVAVGFGAETAFSAAMLDLTGDPVEIVPTDGVESERGESTVTVTSPAWSEGGSETVTVTRAESADETLIREQVMRGGYRGLRNTLSFFESGVDEVALRTDDRIAQQVVGYGDAARRFRVGDEAYQASISDG